MTITKRQLNEGQILDAVVEEGRLDKIKVSVVAVLERTAEIKIATNDPGGIDARVVRAEVQKEGFFFRVGTRSVDVSKTESSGIRNYL